ncbi:type II secretion system F family protein [Candidatus Woesearchaeota archaeon]|nr:type II secretion system F family protein [Candidatus Woesearchaeota archaeon]
MDEKRFKDMKGRALRMLEIIREIRVLEAYKVRISETARTIEENYQKGVYGYFRYQNLLHEHLKDKGLKEWVDYYNASIMELLAETDFLNAQVFYDVYHDETRLSLKALRVHRVTRKEPEPHLPGYPVDPGKVKEERARLFRPVLRKKITTGLTHPETAKPAPAPPVPAPAPAEAAPLPPHRPRLPFWHRFRLSLRDLLHLKTKAGPRAKPGTRKAPAPPASAPPPAPEAFAQGPEKAQARMPPSGPEKEPEFMDLDIGDAGKVTTEAPAEKEGKPIFMIRPRGAADVLPWLEEGARARTPTLGERITAAFRGKRRKRTLFEDLHEEEPEAGGEPIGLQFNIIRMVKRMLSERQQYMGTKTEISPTLLSLRRYREGTITEVGKEDVNATLLAKEARRIKRIIGKESRFSIYNPSSIGSIANVLVRRISLYFIDQYPEFFKAFYNNLRLANIRILSNTYVNMMTLAVLSSLGVFTTFFAVFFWVLGYPPLQILARTLLASSLFGILSFVLFYTYPISRIRQRRRSIRTNLPFAINHMSAVVSSGVPPDAMFRLIVESSEYGEIVVEIEKIVEYVDLFGYDLLTAVNSVAQMTPADELREFFAGFVSTIESGGDLKDYLQQKAEEAMLSYKLERQKYLESISTYSDIYTGILIAAPLFFVVALSLVSMLGGQIGGMEINTVIAIGTYAVIPLLNLGFLVFLQLNQPEV